MSTTSEAAAARECNVLQGSADFSGGAFKLTAAQELAALRIARGDSLSEVARSCHVDMSTLYRWRQSATFKAKLRELWVQIAAPELGELRELRGVAIATLRKILNAEDAASSARVNAARVVLELTAAAELRADGHSAALGEESVDEAFRRLDEETERRKR